MGLEDEVRGREARRNAEGERARQEKEQQEKRFAAELAPLLAEFATALRNRDVSLIPVHEYGVVEYGGYGNGPKRGFYPTREVLGRGWLFWSFHEDADGYAGRRDLVLMSDGATLIEPFTPKSLTRRKTLIGRGYWPRGDFVCRHRPATSLLHYRYAATIAAIRAGMVEFLDKHDHS